MREKLLQLMMKRKVCLQRLEDPARAAANQMKDAGMHRGADPLLEILFELDSIKQEIDALLKDDPEGAMLSLIEIMERSRRQ